MLPYVDNDGIPMLDPPVKALALPNQMSSHEPTIQEHKQRGKARALDKFYEKYYTMKIYNDPNSFDSEELHRDIEEMKQMEKTPTPWGYFITINPREDISLDLLQKQTEKLTRKKWLKEIVYTYEVRRQNTPHGWHVHAYFRSYDKPYSQVKRELLSTFNSLIGNEKHIKIQCINQKDEDKIIKYILGYSKDGHKNPNLYKELRMQNSLLPYYSTELYKKNIEKILSCVNIKDADP